MRNTLVAALVSCADTPHRSRARRFVQGLSSDELQFIAEFLGACVLDSAGNPRASRAQWAERITRYQKVSNGSGACRSADQEHKMILLLEYLCRSGEASSRLSAAGSELGDCASRADSPPTSSQRPASTGSEHARGAQADGRQVLSLDNRRAGLRLQSDFTECRFILGDVIAQDVEQRLGLLRADVDPLEVVDRHAVRRRLIHPAEHQKEIPQVDPNLHTVGVVLAVLRGVDELDLGSRWLRHDFQRSILAIRSSFRVGL